MTERGEGTIVERPLRLDYDYTAGLAQSRFLKGLAQKKILGERCPVCGKVYVGSRGSCPTDGVATEGEVEVPAKGTLTTFCVVNVPVYGRDIELPYVVASVALDGADISIYGLVQECKAEEVEMGTRVQAVWKADGERQGDHTDIKYWKPTGEPDADYETYRHHL